MPHPSEVHLVPDIPHLHFKDRRQRLYWI